jgi:hypothetical protein
VHEGSLEDGFEGTTPGYRAAIEVAEELGLTLDGPLLIQETNNTVVWLRPYPIIAKVGTLEVIDGASTFVMLDRPERLAAEITAFIHDTTSNA